MGLWKKASSRKINFSHSRLERNRPRLRTPLPTELLMVLLVPLETALMPTVQPARQVKRRRTTTMVQPSFNTMTTVPEFLKNSLSTSDITSELTMIKARN
jgi:hypothetical protein